MENLTVCKFGGTSLANPGVISQAISIVRSKPERKVIVVSAPGKDKGFPYKITDLLFNLHYRRIYSLLSEEWDPKKKGPADAGADYDKKAFPEKELLEMIVNRYRGIAEGLNVPQGSKLVDELYSELKSILENTRANASPDLMVSRGEAFNGRLMAGILDAELVEPTSLIFYDGQDAWNNTTRAWINAQLPKLLAQGRRVVIPGFYANGTENGQAVVRVLPRGGSNLTGAVTASELNAALYENWTDISGIFPMNPKELDDDISKLLKPIKKLSYLEGRELTGNGFDILQEDTINSAMAARIPIRICNTFMPEQPGTLISYDNDPGPEVTGISGRKSIKNVEVQKAGIQNAQGFARKLFEIIDRMGLNIEHIYDGQNLMGIGFQKYAISGREEKLEGMIRAELSPDNVIFNDNLAYITLVKQDRRNGTLSRLFTALEKEGIEIGQVIGAETKLSITVGIPQQSYTGAMNALAREFFLGAK
jgi:aspartate kinase